MRVTGIHAVLRDIQLVVYVLLAIMAVRLWRRQGGKPAAWVAAAFGLLGLVVLVGRFLSQGTEAPSPVLVDLLIALIVLFPYLLFRFAASFAPVPKILEVAAGVLTAAAVLASAFLPAIPAPGEPRPDWLLAFTGLLMVQWTLILVFVSARLWRAGRRQATVVRRRVRVLSIAAAALGLGLIVSSFAPQEGTPRTVTQIMSISTAVLFLIGFAPPRALRVNWRIPETEAMRRATSDLMAATTGADVTGILLPHATALVGGRAAALVDPGGDILAFHGKQPETLWEDVARGIEDEGDAPEAARHEILPGLIRIQLKESFLLVWANPWAPFFGREELELIRSLGSLADLALERAALFAQEREFIANASHEMRTPLTAIAGISDTLARRRSDLPEETKEELLDAIGRQGERARVLIQSLLDLSRVRTDERVPTHPVPLAAALQRVVEGAPPPPGTRLIVDASDGLMVQGDPLRVEQILTNLLTNAYRYGGSNVTVSVSAGNGEVAVGVEDDGEGVDPAFAPALFDAFTRGPMQAGTAGSGLGLAISRRLAESFGARLQYRSRQPHGAVFMLTMEAAD